MELNKRLIRVQRDLKAPKTQYNSFGKYNYRNCEDILVAVKYLLAKHELLLTISDEVLVLDNRIVIASEVKVSYEDEHISVKAYAGVDENKKGMDTAQCYGSSSSYARKYALNGMFLIDDTRDSDATNNYAEKKTLTDERLKKAIEACNAESDAGKKNKITTSLKSFDLTDLQKNKYEKETGEKI
jgi:hypothetical protein